MKLYVRGSPKLRKYCPEEYNIKKGCNTLRLGTLYGFRKEEDIKLRDEYEGHFSYQVRFEPPALVDDDWLEEFEVESSGQARINLTISAAGPTVQLVDLAGSCPNCWIFCLSKSSGSAGNVTETHNDFWEFSQDRLIDLAGHIAGLLWESLTVRDLPEGLDLGIDNLKKNLALEIEFRDVEYVDRFFEITDPNLSNVEKIRQVKSGVPFTKPLDFAKEQEVRIAIFLVLNGRRISIPDNTKILNLRYIDELL